ncbi:bifunctional folylpolyglutamate synthase/dihydrofolate synthase [Aestuariimicrobium kwangyangense]|uniref:bifunctional folylpolyglutamate synthase/dihydrofolate synthase n=1 Tax=Aestuariimicrobium kwangyangense TaxID=396389 RepID=UPI0003B2F392|nr:folylpolyglutamate synthase/dihydrofolate synthase family protein [Aestuariimicrobium kwangyangense]
MNEQQHQAIVEALYARWPEHRIAPSLGRMRAICDLMGNPERCAPVIQITGTNGKGSTAAMIDALLRSAGLRTGRMASPHLQDVTERVLIDGEPMAVDDFDELYTELAPLIEIVDSQLIDGVRMTAFEIYTALGFAAFADAPVDVMILEVGMGGSWDATNVADAKVAVITPIDLDHTHILGSTTVEIAREKAGIIKAGAIAVMAGQSPEVAQVLLDRCSQVGAQPVLEGPGFGLLQREVALGGQVIRIETADGPLGDLHLPLHGLHMASNAALAVAAAEALFGAKGLSPDVIADGLAATAIPARMEVVHREPTVVLDTAHNPHGVRATLAATQEAFGFDPLIGVVAMMRDKDSAGVLDLFAELMDRVVVTTVQSTTRALSPDELADLAEDAFGPGRVEQRDSMVDALDRAIQLADEAGEGAGILVVGSFIAAGEARDHLIGRGPATGLTNPLAGATTREWDFSDFDSPEGEPGEVIS